MGVAIIAGVTYTPPTGHLHLVRAFFEFLPTSRTTFRGGGRKTTSAGRPGSHPTDPPTAPPRPAKGPEGAVLAAAAARAAATAATALAAARGADLHHGQRGTERLDTTGLVDTEADDALATGAELLHRQISETVGQVGLDRHENLFPPTWTTRGDRGTWAWPSSPEPVTHRLPSGCSPDGAGGDDPNANGDRVSEGAGDDERRRPRRPGSPVDRITGSGAAAARAAAAAAAAATAATGGADLHHGQRGTERLDTTGLVGTEAEDALLAGPRLLDRWVSIDMRTSSLPRANT
ncbi:hypothetical protein B005_3083 [Nocardiopsis alba ATCC BAA-2165]|uniref:Uncharacterized protein n=1 Tax=Nocardiopsis alba (strain ATCC BAA-2165 / BE74) TaxID=1205910 RepID=J7L7X1_NOCAA|nr:hypothetical protein B005_3083 [Nocardiopsis alba ATCC BAA-2165]